MFEFCSAFCQMFRLYVFLRADQGPSTLDSASILQCAYIAGEQSRPPLQGR